MWEKYFGNKTKIFGIDINPECKKIENEKVLQRNLTFSFNIKF